MSETCGRIPKRTAPCQIECRRIKWSSNPKRVLQLQELQELQELHELHELQELQELQGLRKLHLYLYLYLYLYFWTMSA